MKICLTLVFMTAFAFGAEAPQISKKWVEQKNETTKVPFAPTDLTVEQILSSIYEATTDSDEFGILFTHDLNDSYFTIDGDRIDNSDLSLALAHKPAVLSVVLKR